MFDETEGPKYKEWRLVFDFSRLKKSSGSLSSRVRFEKQLGRFSTTVGSLIVGVVIAQTIFSGSFLSIIVNVSNILGLVFWVMVMGVMYGLFLKRDQNQFSNHLHAHDLQSLKKTKKRTFTAINLTDFITIDVLAALDRFFAAHDENWIKDCYGYLASVPGTKDMATRIGLNLDLLDSNEVQQRSLELGSKERIIQDIFTDSFAVCYENGFHAIPAEVLIFVLYKRFLEDVLLREGITSAEFDGVYQWLVNEAIRTRFYEKWKSQSIFVRGSIVNRSYTSKATPLLNTYSIELTRTILISGVSLALAREQQLNDVFKFLDADLKKGVLLLGNGGVGKSTLLKNLAVKMVLEEIPRKFIDFRLVQFDFQQAHKQLEDVNKLVETIQSVCNEVRSSANVILVIDDFDQLLKIVPGHEDAIAAVFTDQLGRGGVPLVMTSLPDSYTQTIRPRAQLAGSFHTVDIPIPTESLAVQIVFDELEKIEAQFGVTIAHKAVRDAVRFAPQMPVNRVLPDSAIDLLRQVASSQKNKGVATVTEDDLADYVSTRVGTKVGKISEEESNHLLNLEKEMHKRVVGQDAAITAVAHALRRARAGLNESQHPIASFLFYGPTGVGKTEVAKTVAECYYGHENRIIRLDFSEYTQEESLAKLIGATGHNGEFTGGLLTEPVFNNPYSLILLDEIEKASQKVLDIFLHILDEGYVLDGMGRRTDFTNTIIIATSNAASLHIAQLIEQEMPSDIVEQQTKEELRATFRVEFLNRFDHVIMFKPLTREEIKEVAKKFIAQVSLKLHEKGITLDIEPTFLDKMGELGYNPVYGAREMKRVVTEQVENAAAAKMVSGELRSGGVVVLS